MKMSKKVKRCCICGRIVGEKEIAKKNPNNQNIGFCCVSTITNQPIKDEDMVRLVIIDRAGHTIGYTADVSSYEKEDIDSAMEFLCGDLDIEDFLSALEDERAQAFEYFLSQAYNLYVDACFRDPDILRECLLAVREPNMMEEWHAIENTLKNSFKSVPAHIKARNDIKKLIDAYGLLVVLPHQDVLGTFYVEGYNGGKYEIGISPGKNIDVDFDAIQDYILNKEWKITTTTETKLFLVGVIQEICDSFSINCLEDVDYRNDLFSHIIERYKENKSIIKEVKSIKKNLEKYVSDEQTNETCDRLLRLMRKVRPFTIIGFDYLH